ncbi:MAG: hypothetical protein ACHQIM_11945 [Sphingobacteriales bacterium]
MNTFTETEQKTTRHPVDINNSIQKGKLVYSSGYGIVFDYFFSYFVAILVIALISVPTFFSKVVQIGYMPRGVIVLVVLADIWMIANLVHLNTLVKISGKQKEVNKKDILIALADFYKLDNLITGADIIQDEKLSMPGGRVITCLFDDNAVYINKTTLIKNDGLSPFSGLFNYYRCRQIAKNFTLLQQGLKPEKPF